MNDDELRHIWGQTDTGVGDDRLDRLARMVCSRKVKGTRRKLYQFYLYKAILGLCFAPLAAMLYYCGMPVWMCIIYMLYGLMMAVVLYTFSRKILHSNFFSLPLVEALEKVEALERRRTLNFIVGIAGAIPVIACLGILVYDMDAELIPAFWLGVALGLAVAIFMVVKQLRMWGQLKSELADLSV